MKDGLKGSRRWLLVPMSALALVACRSETQNQVRRQVLDVVGGRQYITLYSLGGQTVFQGQVDGKVTRAESDGTNGTGGEYVYWFDERGRYYQTSLAYLVTNDADRTGQITPTSGASGTASGATPRTVTPTTPPVER